jgi:antitoxin (DNA-binding transcriptional repressor) of toxin-antitoxin stability system
LLCRVERGERITITRHGVPVALIVPAGAARARPVAQAVAELQAFGRRRRLGRLSLRRMIAVGRR